MSVQKDPLRLVALMHGAHHLVVRASLAAKPHEQDRRDGLRLLPQIEEALSAWPKPLSRRVDDGRAIEHFFKIEPCDIHELATEELSIRAVNMTDNAKESGVPKWRWLDGASDGEDRVMDASPDHASWTVVGPRWASGDCGPVPRPYVDGDPLPDFDDPATLGCLLALVRAAWGENMVSARWNHAVGKWVVMSPSRGRLGDGDTEAESLVAALEAAP